MFEIRIEGAEPKFFCSPKDTLLRAALRTGLGFPYECNVGACGTCKFELLEGIIEELRPDAPGLSARERSRRKRLGCQSSPVSDCTIRLRLDEAYAPKIQPMAAEVAFVGSRELTHDMGEFQFRGRPAEFLPGQYALLNLPGVTGARAYSMSNIANAEGEWHFQVKKVAGGAASTFLFELLRPGDRISIDAPYSIAYLRPEIPRDIVCIAGGSGLAPMVSIARGMAASEELPERKLHFFYGGRGPADICGKELVEQLPGFAERIFYHPIISMPELDAGGVWDGPVGFVHELVGTTLRPGFSSYEYYLAGPPPMVDACVKLVALQEKVPFSQIHYDRFF